MSVPDMPYRVRRSTEVQPALAVASRRAEVCHQACVPALAPSHRQAHHAQSRNNIGGVTR
eukprot:2340326-Rhodomonas_salina.1